MNFLSLCRILAIISICMEKELKEVKRVLLKEAKGLNGLH